MNLVIYCVILNITCIYVDTNPNYTFLHLLHKYMLGCRVISKFQSINLAQGSGDKWIQLYCYLSLVVSQSVTPWPSRPALTICQGIVCYESSSQFPHYLPWYSVPYMTITLDTLTICRDIVFYHK